MVLHDVDGEKVYATGGQIHVPIYVTGIVKVSNAEIAVLDNDLGSIETQKTLNLAGNDIVSLSANHLQKFRFSFQLTTPRGHAFKPHQAFLKLKHLKHETKYEHIFVVGNAGKKFEIVLVKFYNGELPNNISVSIKGVTFHFHKGAVLLWPSRCI
ncbi:hypothetical protein HN51_029122 [Arachis hypogaea]